MPLHPVQEYGKYKLPAAAWTSFRNAVVMTWNEHQKMLHDDAARMHQELIEATADSWIGKLVRESEPPPRGHYPLIGVRRVHATLSMPDAVIVLLSDTREAQWSVSTYGHIEKAHSHPVAKSFFAELAKVKWTASTGGYLVLSQESTRDGEVVRSVQVREAHGPNGTAEVAEIAARGQGLAYIRPIKSGLR